jgi:predicted glycosyltransferase
MMKIMFEVGHPAQVHTFKYIIRELEKKGHSIKIIAKEKDMTCDLLQAYGLKFDKIGKNMPSMAGKAIGLVRADLRLLAIAKRFKPDIFVSAGSPHSAHISAILGKPHIIFCDTEHAWLTSLLTLSFTDVILTPSCYNKNLGKKQIRLSSYRPLAYLHPNRFIPDPSILGELGVNKDEKFVIIRFISWKASHDVGQMGFTLEEKIKLVKEIEKHAIPFITSEGKIPESLQKYKMQIQPHRIHDALYYARMYVGEGATMATEAAMLGTPSIYVNTLRMGVNDEEEQFGLMKQYEGVKDSEANIFKDIAQMIGTPKKEWINKRDKLLESKIDVTAFIVWFLENYPASVRIMKENPEYQNRFKRRNDQLQNRCEVIKCAE